MRLRSARIMGPTLAAAAMIAAGWATGANADYGYGYAEQTISGLTFTPTLTNAGAPSTSSTAAATFNGSGPSNSDTLDAPQAYAGLGAPPAQNTYAKTAVLGSATAFGRSDSVITSLNPGTASVVSESYVGLPSDKATGTSAVTAGLQFTLTTPTSFSIAYNYANEIFATNLGGGSSTAHFGFEITIKNGTTTVFDSLTGNTNDNGSAPPPSTDQVLTGSETVVTPTLAAGSYTITINLTADSSAQTVPEPASVALLGLGGVAGLVARRRLRAKA